MKIHAKMAVFLVVIAIAASVASPVFANERSPSPKKTPQRSNMIQWVKDLRFRSSHEDLASKSEAIASKNYEFKKEIKNRFTEKRKIQLREWWTRASKRLNMIIGRLNKIADKIAARLDKFAAEGKDVTAQRAELVTARTKITLATQSVASASAQIDSILINNTPADALKKLHDLQSSVIAKIRDAHRTLVTLLASLRNVAP